eukprot:CAMPEP_0196595154 /NCGR_PEP_ID=MMETSP1081-20130531/80331_1 /TAXON_ID=36882 /ORGANISM="Pyramimonas amylifera, Strain CCMP720" /LENGTH=83 /DNA_ID=CAMNT_0041919641 /DNA_START=282 /DNA_END=530 /DNA_ORIENTATION=-
MCTEICMQMNTKTQPLLTRAPKFAAPAPTVAKKNNIRTEPRAALPSKEAASGDLVEVHAIRVPRAEEPTAAPASAAEGHPRVL